VPGLAVSELWTPSFLFRVNLLEYYGAFSPGLKQRLLWPAPSFFSHFGAPPPRPGEDLDEVEPPPFFFSTLGDVFLLVIFFLLSLRPIAETSAHSFSLPRMPTILFPNWFEGFPLATLANFVVFTIWPSGSLRAKAKHPTV